MIGGSHRRATTLVHRVVLGFGSLSQRGDAKGGCRSREGPWRWRGAGAGGGRSPDTGMGEQLCRQRLGLPIPGHEATLQL